MSDEAFLTAVGATPADRSLRLIYADWLEERGDLRGMLIRIEEEMRTLPIHGDRYWELKRRRNELRGRCDADWLRRMRYGMHYEPVFRDVPEDWRGRWRLLREFVERWYCIRLDDVGRSSRAATSIARRLRRPLSPAVREWMVFHGDIKPSWDEVFRDLYHVKYLADLGAVSLLLRLERDHYHAVWVEHIEADDPPVEGYQMRRAEGIGWRFDHEGRYEERLTQFVFRHINFHLSRGVSTGSTHVRLASAQAVKELLNGAFPIVSRFGDIEFFEATNLLGWLNMTRRSLLVKALRPLSRQELPPSLRAHVAEGADCREMVVRWP